MFTKANKIKKIAVVTTVVAAIGAPAAFAQTDGGLLTEASGQATQYAGMVTDGALLTQASRQGITQPGENDTAPQALEASYAGMVTDGALLTAYAQKTQPLAR